MKAELTIIIAVLCIVVGIVCIEAKSEKETNDMVINTPALPLRSLTDNGQIIHCLIQNIGIWNMDADQDIFLVHPLGALYRNIMAVTGFIFPDTGADMFNISVCSGISGEMRTEAWVQKVTAANIILERLAGGFFDSVTFDNAGINRGNIIIWYHE